ncbi:MAG: cellulase family glycosylhydrolase, partial [Planctomycetota bacterium]|nr:cellulase family glycosylhydrolase [Planctomycetota bacterium]
MRITPLSQIVFLTLAVGCGSGGSSGSSSPSSSPASTATNTVVNPTTAPPAALSLKLTADGRWLKDDLGRVVFLNGVNSSVAAKRAPYHSWQSESDYQALPDNGMNFVRLVLQWKAIEPSPGVYDTQFLNELERRLDWCHNQGLIVLLDMHQDAF